MTLRVSDSMAASSSEPDRRRLLAPKEDVRRRVEVVGQGELSGRCTRCRRSWRRADCGWWRLAVDEDLARIGRMRAGEGPDERRLAGAVATDQADDLARKEIDRDAVDGMDATEGDADVAHVDEWRRARSAALVERAGASGAGGSRLASSAICLLSVLRSRDDAGTSRCRRPSRGRCRRRCPGPASRHCSRSMPERSDCMTTAPRMAPGMVPMPPANEVPPITAAEMTSSSLDTPRPVTAALSRAVCTTALMPASRPIRPNVYMIVRFTLMPLSTRRLGIAADARRRCVRSCGAWRCRS